MPEEFHNLILLTGAGFTKNFGGFLASEMWAQIYNHPRVQESEFLRKLLQDDFDYESIYSKVMDDPEVDAGDKDRITEAVSDAYKALDDATKDWTFNDDSPYPVCWYTLGRLLSLFNGSSGKQGLWFTLNQDIFIERRSGAISPGVPPLNGTHSGFHGAAFERANFVTLPGDDAEQKMQRAMSSHAGYVYLKLHGSYGWKASDGTSRLVICKHKTAMIDSEPLLRAYFALFERALMSGGKKILVMGYGFRDAHINAVLAKAVRESGLKIFVLGTSSPEKWKETVMKDLEHGVDIVSGLAGYHPYSLLEMFPKNQQETTHYLNLKRALLRR